MAFDGFTTRALQKELSEKLTGARIYRIVQSEADELLLTLRPEASAAADRCGFCYVPMQRFLWST